MIEVVLVGEGTRPWVTDVDEHDDVEMLTLPGLELSMLRVLLADWLAGWRWKSGNHREPQDARSLRFAVFLLVAAVFPPV